jgi:carbamoyl-phosphate synthase small subunit
MQSVYLYFENGLFLEAKSFGASGTVAGEVVFNTSLTGYQEIITDPSYAGQFITFTMPEIGNVGVNREDFESKGAFCKGVIVRNYQDRYSNFRAQDSLAGLLKEYNILGITDIDTRFITKMLRDEGAMEMVASTEISNKDELKKILNSSPKIGEINYIKEVSTKDIYTHNFGKYDAREFKYTTPKTTKKIIAYDFGIKRNILNELVTAGLEVEVVPANTPASYVIEKFNSNEIGGVFLSNGPGDPLVLEEQKGIVQELLNANMPMFAICLGHQMLSIAHGFDTYKLKFGHHGGNHPVKNREGKVEITAQNHNYNVPNEITKIAEVTHTNLFDNTIEGLKYKEKDVISIQHHTDASPGPHESAYIFKEFAKMVKECR